MSESPIYLKHGCDTKQLKIASYDLNNRSIDIVELCLHNITQVDPLFFQELSIPVSLRCATNPGQFPSRTLEKWQSTETKLLGLLQLVGFCRHPKTIAIKLSEFLDQVPTFQTHPEAFTYFQNAEKRLGYLLSPDCQKRLDSLKLAACSLIESLVLGRAIREGVYLTKPTSHIL